MWAVPENLRIVESELATSLEQNGITWTFAEQVQCGKFANGDNWVVGPVTITRIDPASSNAGGRVINGSEINPKPTGGQGYDSSMTYNSYDASLNVALGVSAQSPLTISNASSLVPTISRSDVGVTPQLRTAAVLTILEAPPAVGSFRPAYVGTNKAIVHNESDINYSLLKSLSPTSSAPSLSSATNYFSRVWLDYRGGVGGRMIHPVDNMPDYGRNMSARSGVVALMLNCNFTNSQKRDMLVN